MASKKGPRGKSKKATNREKALKSAKSAVSALNQRRVSKAVRHLNEALSFCTEGRTETTLLAPTETDESFEEEGAVPPAIGWWGQ